jgi:Ecdysteroid kinase-like family
VATLPNPPTPEWLTNALRQSGTLTNGRVLRVEVSGNAAFNSTALHLHLTYSGDTPPGMPPRLFFKRNLAEAWAVRAGAREVAFYQVATALANRLPMLAHCYGAAYDADSGDSWLLLHDVSETHAPPVTREQLLAGAGVPPDAQLAAIVEVLASLHAAWWEHPALGTGSLLISEWYSNYTSFATSLREFTEEWSTLQQTAGATLPASTRTLLNAALAALPHIWERALAERVAARRWLTISHGDCYLSQFLCPLADSPNDATYLIDFQGACGDLPTMDLVFLLATFWTPEQRHERRREERLLHAYHDALTRNGITTYTWEQLVEDYRIALAFMLFYPVWDAINGSSRDYWEPKLRCLASAADDWRCRELFARIMKRA